MHWRFLFDILRLDFWCRLFVCLFKVYARQFCEPCHLEVRLQEGALTLVVSVLSLLSLLSCRSGLYCRGSGLSLRPSKASIATNQVNFLNPEKCPSPLSFSSRRKIASDRDSFCDLSRKKRPHCGLAGDGNVCDRKLQRFAIAIFGALRAALLREKERERERACGSHLMAS